MLVSVRLHVSKGKEIESLQPAYDSCGEWCPSGRRVLFSELFLDDKVEANGTISDLSLLVRQRVLSQTGK